MIRAIFDTNVLVQATISSRGASYRAVWAALEGKIMLAFSAETLRELLAVLNLDTIQSQHGWSVEEIDDYISLLIANADLFRDAEHESSSLTRDVSDTKFLTLARTTRAEYLVTNDRRHLLRLKHYLQTAIVTPAEFLRRLT